MAASGRKTRPKAETPLASAPTEGAIAAARDRLFQADRGLYLAPIRHHSPACAAALRAMLRELRPVEVLIEAPIDFEPLIPLLLDAETRPPVALAAILQSQKSGAKAEGGARRLAAYYPFCAHSPEYLALREAEALGAAVRFIDSPAARLAEEPDTHTGEDADGDAEGSGLTGPDRPIPLQAEHRFNAGDYVAALARRLGCRDGFELWDHLFETRLGQPDWRAFFSDVGAYCAGLRAASSNERPPVFALKDQDAAREAHMAHRIAEALERAAGAPVVAVIGGYHAPALIEPWDAPAARPRRGAPAAVDAYLVRYGFAALDALNGYGAGLPQPGYYDRLWREAETREGPPDWPSFGAALAADFAARARAEGAGVSLPAQVEMLRMASTLAALRGRPGALRQDLIDGLRAALLKGEGADGELWTERFLAFLRGDALGDAPPSAGSPPLVEDARRRARACRLDISDGASRRRKLDIRRKPAHLAASRFLHATALLATGFATREIGPDYVHDMRADLLFEEWRYAWSPAVEGRLIELAALADDVPGAGLALLWRRRAALIDEGRGDDLDAMTTLLAEGLLAGLGARLGPLLEAVAGDIRSRGEFGAVARALRRLHRIAVANGPLAPPAELDLPGARAAAYARIVYLCDDLPETPDDALADRLSALRIIADLLRGPGGEALDRALFDQALERVSAADPPAEILGAALGISAFASADGVARLVSAVEGRLRGALEPTARIGVLRGALSADPTLLWRADGLLAALDAFLGDLEEEAFLEILPHLRLAFTGLTPRETDQVAALLARRHGQSAGAFSPAATGFAEMDLLRGSATERAIRAAAEADGLGAWLEFEGREGDAR